MKKASKAAQPRLAFASAAAWRAWLVKHHAASDGVWLTFYKKHTGKQTFTYGDALDEALCFGWIDGQSKSRDERTWVQRFTPRRARSTWSKRNREHVARLIKEKRVTAAGLAQVAAAKKDGRWERAYDSPDAMKVPADFLRALAKDKKAKAFFQGLNRANHYAIAWRLQTAAKPETRKRRFEALLAMMKEGKKLH